MEMRLLDLEQVDPEEREVFGGKACGLAALLRAGARVPPGFAVSATLRPTADWSAAARGELVARSQDLLARGALAVRSSALSEDSATKSFAGLFETVLGVKDDRDLLAAVDRCVASGSSLRVRTYAETDDPLPVGVVVQSEVVARASGVCFTADPSGRDRAVVVEAVLGKGEALVSGRAQPEAWRLYRSGLGGWEARREGRAGATVLEDGYASRLAEAATALAGRFGHALDLEWAIGDDGALWWLQARPVTAAVLPRDFDVERYCDGVDDGPVSVWSNWNVREVVPEVFLPLNWSLWRRAVIPSVVEPLFGVARSSRLFFHAVPTDLVHGRLYWNMNALLAAPLYGKLFPRLLHRLDARAGVTMKELVERGILRPRRLPGSGLSRTLGVLPARAPR
jgi:pyruvate,water dikinase